MLKSRFAFFLIAASITLFSGCGGGGGGGGGGASTPPAGLLGIDTSNAPAVAGTVAGASASTTNLGPTGPAVIGGVSIDGGATSTGLVQLAVWQLTEISTLPPQPANMIGAAMMSGSKACTGGGSFAYQFNDADLNGVLSIRETLSITFNNCAMTAGGAPGNGGFTVVLNSVTGTPGTGAWSGSITMTFSNMTLSGTSVSGDMTFKLSSTNSSDIGGVLSGSSISVTNATGKVDTLSGYNFTLGYNKSTTAYTLDATGTVSRSDLGGTVSFSTPSTLAGKFSNRPDNPVSGVFLVTGANNSKLRMTAIDNSYVKLEVDANGDGTYEFATTKTWAEISAL